MNDELSSVSLAPYVDILHRHRLSFVCTLAVGLLLTVMAVVVLPNVYLSTTLVTIEPQEVPAQYVSAGVTNHIQDRLKILGEKVLSRTQLERIIQQFNLYPERRAKHAATEQLVNYMRGRVDLEVTKEDENAGGGSFELSFEYTDPVIAQQVTGELADGFIAEDRRGRTQQAAATTAFLNDRLANARTKLDAKAGEIKNFKDRYQGSLPQDLQVNLQTLSALQNRLQTANEAQMALDERRAQVGREMADARNVTITSPAGGAAPVSPEVLKAIGLADGKPFYTVDFPYLWGRLREDNSIVWGAGLADPAPSGRLEDVRIDSGDPARMFASLERRIRGLHPALGDARFTHRWGGPILFRENWSPVFDRHPASRDALIIGAFAGHGVALSSYLGAWAAEIFLGRRDLPEWGRI